MKRSRIKPISEKQEQEIYLRIIVREMLMVEQGGKCSECGGRGDWRGLSLSHSVPLARGGKTDTINCKLLCGICHDKRHGL